MTLSTVIQDNHLGEQKLQYIRAHQDAFDVEPVFPIQLFEEFVVSVKSNCQIEASCKVEADKLIASRFVLFFQDPDRQWQKHLTQAISFLHQIERRVEVNFNYDLLQNFIGNDFDFSKITMLTIGIDLRSNLADSSLKMHIGIEKYPEKIQTAASLAKINSVKLDPVLLQTVSHIGFDFFFNGRSEIELYARLDREQLHSQTVKAFLKKNFPPAVLKPFEVSTYFYVGLSKANSSPVLYYCLEKKDLLNYFKLNDMGYKVHSFYQQQATRPQMWVGVTQKELEKNRIDNIRLYYYKNFCY